MMENENGAPAHRRRPLITWLAGYAIFAAIMLLAFSRSSFVRVYAEWWLGAGALITLAYAFGVVKFALREVRTSHRLPLMFEILVDPGLFSFVKNLVRDRLAARLTLIGLLTALLVFWIASEDLLFNQNLRMLSLTDPSMYPAAMDTGNVRIFQVGTQGIGLKERLVDMLKLARDLKAAGVKAALIPVPSWYLPAADSEVMREINATGIVVFGVTPYRMFGESRNPRGKFAPNPFAVYRSQFPFRWGVLSSSTIWNSASPGYFFTVPCGYFSFNRRMVPDAAIEVLKLADGIPERVDPKIVDGYATIGKYTIPVTDDGYTLHRRTLHTSGWMPCMATDAMEEGVFGYAGNKTGGGKVEKDLSNYTDVLTGKIVVVLWYDELNEPGASWPEIMNYPALINEYIRHASLTLKESWGLSMSIGAVFAAVILFIRLRLRSALVVTSGLLVLTAAYGFWMYHSHSVVLGMIYPVLTFGICMIVFSFAKLSVGEGKHA